MKISKSRLKQIIYEEFRDVVLEQSAPPDTAGWDLSRVGGRASAAEVEAIEAAATERRAAERAAQSTRGQRLAQWLRSQGARAGAGTKDYLGGLAQRTLRSGPRAVGGAGGAGLAGLGLGVLGAPIVARNQPAWLGGDSPAVFDAAGNVEPGTGPGSGRFPDRWKQPTMLPWEVGSGGDMQLPGAMAREWDPQLGPLGDPISGVDLPGVHSLKANPGKGWNYEMSDSWNRLRDRPDPASLRGMKSRKDPRDKQKGYLKTPGAGEMYRAREVELDTRPLGYPLEESKILTRWSKLAGFQEEKEE